MPVRVEPIDEAIEDLERYADTGNLPLFLKKLLRFTTDPKDTVATVWVIGDRDDSRCYEHAHGCHRGRLR